MNKPTHIAYQQENKLIIERTKSPRFKAVYTPNDQLSHIKITEWVDPTPKDVGSLAKLMQEAGEFLAQYLSIKRPVFEDAHAQSLLTPDTFEVPSNQEIKGLKAGGYAKVCCGGERFWILITQVNQNSFIGRVDNDLVNTSFHGLDLGDVVEFKPENIYQVY